MPYSILWYLVDKSMPLGTRFHSVAFKGARESLAGLAWRLEMRFATPALLVYRPVLRIPAFATGSGSPAQTVYTG